MQFPEFVRILRIQYGEEAAAVRHEIYFLDRHGRLAVCRAVLAALRDAWLCVRLPPDAPAVDDWAALSSLPGDNGWGALAPCVEDLERRGVAATVLIHPRLRGRIDGQLPARPARSAWRHALQALSLRFAPVVPGPVVVPGWVVRCSVFRLRLWHGAWARTLPPRAGATLLLHNDFDLYAVAAQGGAGAGWTSLCVQHGLPTDEFFPMRAHRHLLWGPTSARVYARHGVPVRAMGYGPRRAIGRTGDPGAPTALCIVSQTHTPVYGCDLAPRFLALAQSLEQELPEGMALHILLHPEELRSGHPYTSSSFQALCRRPPHAMLQSDAAPALVVGFCSTALLQAADRGHFVVGMDWQAPASADAQEVGRPARQLPDAASLGALARRLLVDACARREFLAQQHRWLLQTFASDKDWVDRVGGAGAVPGTGDAA